MLRLMGNIHSGYMYLGRYVSNVSNLLFLRLHAYLPKYLIRTYT